MRLSGDPSTTCPTVDAVVDLDLDLSKRYAHGADGADGADADGGYTVPHTYTYILIHTGSSIRPTLPYLSYLTPILGYIRPDALVPSATQVPGGLWGFPIPKFLHQFLGTQRPHGRHKPVCLLQVSRLQLVSSSPRLILLSSLLSLLSLLFLFLFSLYYWYY